MTMNTKQKRTGHQPRQSRENPIPPGQIMDPGMVKNTISDPMAPISGTVLSALPLKYEYSSVLLSRSADINKYGADGWELVSVTAAPGDQAMFYFRRVK